MQDGSRLGNAQEPRRGTVRHGNRSPAGKGGLHVYKREDLRLTGRTEMDRLRQLVHVRPVPVVTLALAAWVVNEPITLPAVIGAALVMAGVWFGALSATPNT